MPQRAVLRSPDGSAAVLVMDGEGRAQQRPVQTGAMQGARWQIRDGLKVGDRVIVSGLAGLQPGAKVEPKSALATASGSQQ